MKIANTPLRPALLLSFVLLLANAPASFAGSGGGWPGAYPDFCGVAAYGTGQSSGDASFALRLNRTNRRLKNICIEVRAKIDSSLNSSVRGCGPAPQAAKEFLQRYEALCSRAKVSANDAYNLCAFYDGEGHKAEMAASQAVKGAGGSQRASLVSASGVAASGINKLYEVKARALRTADKIESTIPDDNKKQGASNPDRLLESLRTRFAKAAAGQRSCQNFAKVLKAGALVVQNNLFPNIRVLADGAKGVANTAGSTAHTLESERATIDQRAGLLAGDGSQAPLAPVGIRNPAGARPRAAAPAAAAAP